MFEVKVGNLSVPNPTANFVSVLRGNGVVLITRVVFDGKNPQKVTSFADFYFFLRVVFSFH
ncbi:hypothetical protein GCM10008983_23740 [Lentibacillus halophilus]|uniref:Uncharacterized protein n=1 Tax=Lentibacillus halophilus TaxID=295065 RepID=A0ABN0ZES7_9BACI